MLSYAPKEQACVTSMRPLSQEEAQGIFARAFQRLRLSLIQCDGFRPTCKRCLCKATTCTYSAISPKHSRASLRSDLRLGCEDDSIVSEGSGQPPASSTAPHDGARHTLLAERFFSEQPSELIASDIPLLTMGSSAGTGIAANAAFPCMEGVTLQHALHSWVPRPAAVLCDFDQSTQYSPHVMQRQRTAAEFYP
jgi:hypothetical protein